MAVGRISGPLLKANLLRNGVDLAFETDLLYLDVVNDRIGIKKSNPSYELDVNGTVQATNIIATNSSTTGNLTLQGNTISSTLGTIELTPSGSDPVIYHSKIRVDSLEMNDNTISTIDSNAPIELAPNGTGSIELLGNTNVTGNIYATGNITAGGNINLGDTDSDTVSFKAGMVVSNEPGYYEKNNFGIRIENLVYVKKNRFDNLTMVPIDKSLIDKKILNNKEKNWINNYHKKVHGNLKKFMNKKEISELNDACSAI